jgi:hypothetical protein
LRKIAALLIYQTRILRDPKILISCLFRYVFKLRNPKLKGALRKTFAMS